jgi:hypothetical protein
MAIFANSLNMMAIFEVYPKTITATSEKRANHKFTNTSPADVIQFSGCKDYQVADDTVEHVRFVATAANREFQLAL